MYFRTLIFALLLTVAEIKGKELDPGPQAVKEATDSKLTSPSAADSKSQKRYATKEVILYLTPSQIKALQAGKGLVSPQSIPQTEEKQQQQNDQQLTFQEHEAFVKQQFENIKSAKISAVQEPQYDISSFGKDELSPENLQKNVEFFDLWKKAQAKAEEQAKLHYSHSEIGRDQQVEQWNFPDTKQAEAERNAWLSYGSVSQKNQEDRLAHEQVKQQWNRIVEQNHLQLKALSTFIPEKETPEAVSTPTEKPLLQFQYAPRHNDQKNAIEIEKIIRQHHREELEKQSALAKAEAIANAPPILVHQEVKITKHHPVPIVKHVKVSVPTPVLVPVPEPYEVKVPHPYPVPLEIIKPIPVPILRTEKVEVERPVPYEVEKHIPVPVTKQVLFNVDRPYYVQKLVPVEIKKEVPVEIPIRKAEKITILRHVWNN